MTRWINRTWCLLVLFLAATFTFAQTEFSAELFANQKSEPQSKIYFGKDKIQFESEKKDPRDVGALIMNLATHTSTVIMDQRTCTWKMPTQTTVQRYSHQFIRPGDVDSTCSEDVAIMEQRWNLP